MKVAFDIGGVISKHPGLFRTLIEQLIAGGSEVFVVTDMHDHSVVCAGLRLNGFGMIPPENVRCADYATHGEGCKAEILRELSIDMFFDDFIGYVALPGCPVRFLLMPDAEQPYWHEEWQTSGESDFGRRSYRKPTCPKCHLIIVRMPDGSMGCAYCASADVRELGGSLADQDSTIPRNAEPPAPHSRNDSGPLPK